MSWLLLALGAGLGSALNVFASKLLVKNLPPILLGASVHLLGGIIICAFLPFTALTLTGTPSIVLGLVGLTVVYTLGNAFYFTALRDVQLSEIDLLLRSSSIWTLLGGVLFLSEPLGWQGALGAFLILVSLTVLAEKPRRLVFRRPQLLALGAALSFGAGNVLDKALSPYFDPLSYTALNLLLTGFGMVLLARQPLNAFLQAGLWQGGAWIVAATFALTQLLLILAFQAGGSAGEVILVAQVRVVLLGTAGILLLGERDRLLHKGVAATFIFVGIYLLSVGWSDMK